MKLFFETINESRSTESITQEVWDNTSSKALATAFDRDLLSVYKDGNIFWVESRGCPDSVYKIAIRETKRIFPNLEYLYDLPASRDDNYVMREDAEKFLNEDGRLNPRRENIRKVCDAMNWNLPTFSDETAIGYACKWGGHPFGKGKSTEELAAILDEIKDKTGLECAYTRGCNKLVIPFNESVPRRNKMNLY